MILIPANLHKYPLEDTPTGFKVGKFHYDVDNNFVNVTKDTPDGLFENVAVYEYASNAEAEDVAERMAIKQYKAY